MKTEGSREEKINLVKRNYELYFAGRGGITPTSPLEFHLFQLARYWSRFVGFGRILKVNLEAIVDGDLGICVEVGTMFTHELIQPESPVYELWNEYWRLTQKILRERPVTLNDIESASKALDKCFEKLKFDPWRNTPASTS